MDSGREDIRAACSASERSVSILVLMDSGREERLSFIYQNICYLSIQILELKLLIFELF